PEGPGGIEAGRGAGSTWRVLGPHVLENVPGDLLDARVRTVALSVPVAAHVPRWLRQSVGPPARGGVEDEVAVRSGIHRGGEHGCTQFVLPVLVGETPPVGDVARDHLQTRDVGGVAVEFPADQARDALAEFHAGALE